MREYLLNIMFIILLLCIWFENIGFKKYKFGWIDKINLYDLIENVLG